jgi:hypothetical protein
LDVKFIPTVPPRPFEVGRGKPIHLKDCGRVELTPDEQVTFVTESGAEYDVVRKSWGFYATPSMNSRLRRFGLRAVLVKSPDQKVYVFLVEQGKEGEFTQYLAVENQMIIHWLDSDAEVASLVTKLGLPSRAKG